MLSRVGSNGVTIKSNKRSNFDGLTKDTHVALLETLVADNFGKAVKVPTRHRV